jgi:hypothetical protein
MSGETVKFLQGAAGESPGLYPGLAVIKHLTGKYASEFAVKSTPGVGTEIVFHMSFRTAVSSPMAANSDILHTG